MTSSIDTAGLKALDQAHHLHPFTDLHDYAAHGGRILCSFASPIFDASVR